MKKTFNYLSFILISFIVVSCSNGPGKKLKEARDMAKQATSTVKNLSKIEKNSEEYEKNIEKLKNITPFTVDKFKDWMPEDLGGMKRKSFEFSSALGNQGSMTFSDETEGNSIDFTIIDGAGEMGSVVYASMSFITGFMDNYVSESDNKVEKIVEKKGYKAMETYYKEDNICEIKAVVDDRFIVNVNSRGIGLDETWNLIEKLSVNKLK